LKKTKIIKFQNQFLCFIRFKNPSINYKIMIIYVQISIIYAEIVNLF
jgi:hypothetical protein